LTALLGLIAMAMDLGLIMMARSQAQSAADTAALAGARSLNGNKSANNNYSGASSNAMTIAKTNSILGQQITAGQVTPINIGDYYYSYSNNSFSILPTSLGDPTDNWNLVQVTVNFNQNASFFAPIFFGMNGWNTQALATAAHRPRDVVIVQDFSGSMRLDSMMGMPKNASITQTMLPLDKNDNAGNAGYPLFGHWSATSTAQMSALENQPPGPPKGFWVNDTGELCSPGNLVNDTSDGPKIVDYYFSDTSALGSTTKAFSAAANSYASAPAGDQWLQKNKNTTNAGYATDVGDIVGSSTTWDLLWELDGYAADVNGQPNPALKNQTDYSAAPFKGYTQGPGYFGKSFMIWPPDPRTNQQLPITSSTAPSISWFISQILGASDPSKLSTKQQGIYTKNTQTGSNNWYSWTSSNLSNYLQNTVGLSPGGNQQYEQIMRLFNRGYPAGPNGGNFSADWRARFFFQTDGATPLTDNSKLWSTSNGYWQPPNDGNGTDNYRINYNAILAWISASATSPATIFPAQVRSGGIKYYTQIPTSIDVTNFPPSDVNQRFWKEFIDEVLGLQQTGLNSGTPAYQVIIDGNNCQAGIGADYTWNDVQITAQSSSTNNAYMNYGDNPLRWRTKSWFGPMNFVHFLSNWNMNRWWWSGTCSEAPTFQCKLGMQAALKDIQNNHPNDNAALVFFSTPMYGANQGGQFNTARMPLTHVASDFTKMQNLEWFHPWTLNNSGQEFTPYDSQNSDGNFPRAGGGTCYAMGLMLAHNQLSSNSSLRTATAPTSTKGIAGGLGRIGASKLVILESDGACKDKGSASLNGGTNYDSYWKVVVNDSTNPGGGGSYPGGSGVDFGNAGTVSGSLGNWTVTGASGAPGDALTVAAQMCNFTSANGLSSATKPVTIHCVAFGSLFNSNNNSTRKTTCLSLMHNLEVLGNVQPVSGGASPSGIASSKIITGPWNSPWPNPGRVQLMQQAYQQIMADGFQVVLLASTSTGP
jgi:hypothetical protein